MYKIHNDVFCLSITKFGAELEEICVDGVNILWDGKQNWLSRSPILFPIIGNLKDGYYEWCGQKYFLNTHGFIKNVCFEVIEKLSNSITFKSRYSEDTLFVYPFKYEIYITYTLIQNKISVTIDIKNIDNKDIPFSLGFHPGFDYFGLKKLLGTDLHLDFFENKVNLVSFDPVFVESIEEKLLPQSKCIEDLSKELILKKTICYQGLQQVDLCSKKRKIRIKHSMPFLAFWQSNPKNPKFLCVEPWDGLPDEKQTNHKIMEKKYIQKIATKQTYKAIVEIEYLKE